MQANNRRIGLTVGFWLFLLAVVLIWKGVVTVQPGEIGILKTFSRASHTPLEPGLHFIVPFVQQVGTVKLSAIRKEIILSEARRVRGKDKLGKGSPRNKSNITYFLTSDENLVTVDASAQYRIKDPWDYTFNARQRDEIVRDLARHVLATELMATAVDDVLSRGRAELLHRLHERLQQECSRLELGILVTSFLLGDVVPPRAAISSFQKVSDARAESEQIRSQAQAKALETKAKANGQASGQLAGASSYRADRLANARGKAERFDKLSAEYRKAPRLMRRRLALDALKRTLPDMKKVYYDPHKRPPSIHLAP
ncbi:MAG TPA: FtsH protease activity modulator HflK [Myxococcota bacterium]|nr:FtsH protease activity modulator HflK [Myxococcota bacterium]